MRKQPRQQRSRALVDSLVDAATITLSQEGLERATTGRIAERAGVSVGSLYQYFPDKHALYDAVLERITDELEALVEQQMLRQGDASVAAFTRALLGDVWTFLDADNALYLGVVRHWAQLDFARFLKRLEQRMAVSFGLWLLPQQDHVTAVPRDLPVQVFILINSVLFTIVRYISDPPAYISREQLIEQFVLMAQQMLGDGTQTSV